MPHRGSAGQTVDHFPPGESVTDQAETAFRMEALTIEGNDARGFLTPVLKSVQAKGRDRSRIRMTEDAEHPAFLAQAIGVGVEVRISHRRQVL
jgi:hypothetical protein